MNSLKQYIQRAKFDLYKEHIKGISTLQSTRTSVNSTMETNSEIKEIGLDGENYGIPPENSGITLYKNGINTPQSSDTEPQAREGVNGGWFYNLAGAVQLAKTLGRTLPNLDELTTAMKANPQDFLKNPDSYDCPEFDGHINFSEFWSAPQVEGYGADYGAIHPMDSSVNTGWSRGGHWFLVRFMQTKK